MSDSGLSSVEKAEPTSAKCRIAEVETELAIHRRASELQGEVVPPRRDGATAVMAAEGPPVHVVTCPTPPNPATSEGFHHTR